ncbi:FERM, ARHGEF and pleckstrin domain-containing protein 1-like isoform X1 [Lytechinus variegatus]|uniref:FERM, ARHGEF and pleckstrin domain-containing protein 1-like isoform X1 n=1 Tax=Lytechinus variegatus TaxID=7654 RepID=UPI001BB17835|nr:FERM, ARHGEF and pleckstrin domain-containing protein 1-like isoform X1 [Lytechinus variegatus]XP_041483015.1 FERM, ARHGEF and pleckstrin domain-containing protein 1-like isoform X1 [Lytechinus variegatus]
MSDYEAAGSRGEPVPVSPMKREDSMALSQLSENHGRYNDTTLSREGLSDRETSYSYGGYSPAATPTHSYSTARSDGMSLGRDGTTPRKKGKTMSLKVQMLDDSVLTVDVVQNATGVDVFLECCRCLNLYEMDYFGLEYYTKGDHLVWLEPEKPVLKQVAAPKKTLFHFSVKFYLSDPGQLHEEFTKYLFALQVKKDLANGRLPCSENTAALMASYILQAEVGDYSPMEHDDGRYITAFRFVPNQSRPMELKIQEYHKNHIGQTMADADFNLLDVARRLEMYGVRLHPAKDYENVQLYLAVSHQGTLVFQNNTKINTFSWAKIRKLSFKRKRFLIKLHPEGFGYPRSTVEFQMETRNDCKQFWKSCVEHHAFFRLTQIKYPRSRRRLLSRGSTFRYSGRTQKQVVEQARVGGNSRSLVTLNASRMSTRSLGAPRTTTPLTIDMTETIVTDHHSAPNLAFPDDPTYAKPDMPKSPVSESPTSPPSSTPITPVHENSRIAIHKGQSNSSIMYEYTVNDDNSQQQNQAEVDPSQASRLASSSGSFNARMEPEPLVSSGETRLDALSDAEPKRNGDINMGGNQSSPAPSPTKSIPTYNNDTSEVVSSPVSNHEEEPVKKKRHPPDRAYFIAKEILTTERTYLKDLEVVVVWFRKATTNEANLPETLDILFSHLDPIYEFHCKFLKEVEQRLSSWEGRPNAQGKGGFQRVGDILLKNAQHLKLYTGYIGKLEEILSDLEASLRKNKKFESFYRDFEIQKVCYLPFNTFLLKPVQRLLHYKLVLERLVKHYQPSHPDYKDCKAAMGDVGDLTADIEDSVKRIENFQKLTELQRDLVGMDTLIQPNRHFIREGCLHKLSRKGYQQRMFFLFSDVLVYTSKGVTPTNQFKVHGQIPLKGVVLEDSELDRSVANCFTLYGGNKTVVIAASTPEEKLRWMEDIRLAMSMCQDDQPTDTLSSPDQDSAFEEAEDDVSSPSKSIDRQSHHRANTTVHVCWHRNTSVSMADHVQAVENQLSGFLLRKFKNSNGWQKLWVVFTNFCLFFYKSHQDDYPLASLPLLGYSVMIPAEEDDIRKDYVFKLQFKTHVYFFRAESEYTFSRWMEVLKSATYSSKMENDVM